VRGFTDAPISWPSTRRTGGFSPILCDDLVRAVRTTSSRAICHHWGVSKQTVWKWREAWEVPRWNEPTQRLHRRMQAERWDRESLADAGRKSQTRQSRAKMSARRKGRPPHRHFQAAAAEAARRPKSESFKQKTSRRIRREWQQGLRHRHPRGRAGTEAETKRRGRASDEGLARELRRTVGAAPCSASESI
jgi:hypothetical protein